jgi:transcriptional regulator with XRE-family HTH domain
MGKQAFNAPRKQLFMFKPEELVIVGLDKPFDDAPRDHELYDRRKDMKLDSSFVEDILLNGVMQSVDVTKVGNVALVVDGRQRVKGGRKANEILTKKGVSEDALIRIPCRFVQMEDPATMLGRLISANSHRHDDGIIEKAEKAARLINLGKTQKEVAIRNGVTGTTISNWMKVLQCITAVKRAVDQGLISASAAAELANMSPEEQKTALDDMLEEGATTTADAKKKAAQARGSSAPKKPGKKIVRQIIDERPEIIEENPIFALQWAIGDLDPEEEFEDLYEAIISCGG